MRFGFRIIDDMVDGLNNWMDSKGHRTLEDFRGKAVANVTDWNQLDLNYKTLAVIDQDMCIECGLCHIVCEDASHQAISKHKDVNGKRTYTVIDDECVGCNLCALVCPVQDCITMEVQDTGLPYLNWGDHPNNPG
jgi:dihydropyrimidine dehydrogenase (NAD+) subunit PreA